MFHKLPYLRVGEEEEEGQTRLRLRVEAPVKRKQTVTQNIEIWTTTNTRSTYLKGKVLADEQPMGVREMRMERMMMKVIQEKRVAGPVDVFGAVLSGGRRPCRWQRTAAADRHVCSPRCPPVTPKTSQITSGGTVQKQRDRLLISTPPSSPPVIGEPYFICHSTDRGTSTSAGQKSTSASREVESLS